jgi:hypothetical protein
MWSNTSCAAEEDGWLTGWVIGWLLDWPDLLASVIA